MNGVERLSSHLPVHLTRRVFHGRLGADATRCEPLARRGSVDSTVGNRIDQEKALQIARAAASERGFAWFEPSTVTERVDSFLVTSNAEEIGGNVVAVVDKATGELRSITSHRR